MKSPTSLISIRNAVGAMLALSAIFAVVISSVTITQDRAFGQSTDVSVTISGPATNADEDDGTVSVTVTLATAPSAEVTIPLTVTEGTAKASTATQDPQNNDYVNPTTSSATVAANATTGTLSITIVDDEVDEEQEYFTVSLGTLPSGYAAGDTSSVKVYIDEDDNAAPSPTTVTINFNDKDGNLITYDHDDDTSTAEIPRDTTNHTPMSGESLVANVSEVEDVDNDKNSDNDGSDPGEEPTFKYQWIRLNDGSTTADDANEAISGATSSTYTLTDDDVGDTFTVQVWSSDQYGNGNGNASAAVIDADPDPDVTVIAAGTNGFALSQPATATNAVDYNLPIPFIIVGALPDNARRGLDDRKDLTPGVVLTADWSGMFKLDTSDSQYYLVDINGDFITVDLDDDDTTVETKVLFSSVTFSWNRWASPTSGPEAIRSEDCGATAGTEDACSFTLAAIDDNATDEDPDITYTLVDEDVAKTMHLHATFLHQNIDGDPATTNDNAIAIILSDGLSPVRSTNIATGKPVISGKTQVGETLTASKGTIADADGSPAETDITYYWFYGEDWDRLSEPGVIVTSIHTGPTYLLGAKDANKTLLVRARFMDVLGDREVRASDRTNTVAGSPGMISKIEPGIRGVVVSGGDSVKLEVEVYGLQGKMDQSLANGITLTWSVEPSSGSLPAAAAGNSVVTYTAPTSPGSYTVTAMVSDGDCQPDDEAMRETACSASFDVRVRRSAPTQPEPAAPANPPGDIPTILTDSAGNQYEVFTPVEGGTFDAGEGYSIVAPSGAVPNGEFIGVRMSDDGSASNAGMTHQRYTLGGNMYGVHVVNSDGGSVSDYPLEEAAKVCVPLPDMFRARISDLALVTINSDGSLTILAANVRLGNDGSASVCGNLSELPASVAVGSMGAPDAIPTATPVPTPVPPPTGATAPSSNGAIWALALGTAILLLGATIALTTTTRRRKNSSDGTTVS